VQAIHRTAPTSPFVAGSRPRSAVHLRSKLIGLMETDNALGLFLATRVAGKSFNRRPHGTGASPRASPFHGRPNETGTRCSFIAGEGHSGLAAPLFQAWAKARRGGDSLRAMFKSTGRTNFSTPTSAQGPWRDAVDGWFAPGCPIDSSFDTLARTLDPADEKLKTSEMSGIRQRP